MRIPIPVNISNIENNGELINNILIGISIFSAIVAISLFIMFMYINVNEKRKIFSIFRTLLYCFAIFYLLTFILGMIFVIIFSWF